MSHRYSHLVWLGAGTASTPAGITDLADQVTLVEARQAACLSLQKKFPQKNIKVIQRLITTNSERVNFTEYNLAEYSAIQPMTGLKKLFPGIKTIANESFETIGFIDFIEDLALAGSNNVLVMDIADSSLSLITALYQSNHLKNFSKVYVQTSTESLYENSPTSKEIVALLERQGYLLQYTINPDPDLPCLEFNVNPLLSKLQQLQADNDLLIKSNEELKNKASVDLKEKEAQDKALKQLKQQLVTAQDQNNLINKLNADLEQINKHAAARQEKISQLEQINRCLQESNIQVQKKQHALEQELLKAEAHIEFISDLLLKK
jgi:hypothetical protein